VIITVIAVYLFIVVVMATAAVLILNMSGAV
jgi:hypothetical protein